MTVVGLANVTDFHTFTLAYTRQINANFSVNALIGLVGTTGDFTFGLPRTLLPIYTVGTMWSLTPKLVLNASASKTISPPTTVIANAETAYTAQISLTYAMTPKVAVNVGGSISYTSGAFTPVVTDRPGARFDRRFGFLRRKRGLELHHHAVYVRRAERLIYRACHGPHDYPARFVDRKPEL